MIVYLIDSLEAIRSTSNINKIYVTINYNLLLYHISQQLSQENVMNRISSEYKWI